MNDVNVVARTLVSLFENRNLSVRLKESVDILEKEFGFDERLLDTEVDKLLIPDVVTVGNFSRVYFEGNVYYYDKFLFSKFDRKFMRSPEAFNRAILVIDTVNNVILNNRFIDVTFVFDEYFSRDEAN